MIEDISTLSQPPPASIATGFAARFGAGLFLGSWRVENIFLQSERGRFILN